MSALTYCQLPVARQAFEKLREAISHDATDDDLLTARENLLSSLNNPPNGIAFPIAEDVPFSIKKLLRFNLGLILQSEEHFLGCFRGNGREVRAAAWEDYLQERIEILPDTASPKGKPGRRGYPKEAREFALALRRDFPEMPVKEIRRQCLLTFNKLDMPASIDSFRTWVNRKRKNRTN